jgi:tRNA nucleotidyltransferase/poly(A) polymerase
MFLIHAISMAAMLLSMNHQRIITAAASASNVSSRSTSLTRTSAAFTSPSILCHSSKQRGMGMIATSTPKGSGPGLGPVSTTSSPIVPVPGVPVSTPSEYNTPSTALPLYTNANANAIAQATNISTGTRSKTHTHTHSRTFTYTNTHTVLNAIESRELRFYNSSPLSSVNSASSGSSSSSSVSSASSNGASSSSVSPIGPITNSSVNSNGSSDANNLINTAAASMTAGANTRIGNGNSPATATGTNTSTGTSTDTSSNTNANIVEKKTKTPNVFDLSQQVSYFTSIFHQSNFNKNNKIDYTSNASSNSANGRYSTTSSSLSGSSSSSSNSNNNMNNNSNENNVIRTSTHIDLTKEEQELFDLLAQVITTSDEVSSTLRVAGGWVRDKLLATDEFQRRGSSTMISAVNGINGAAMYNNNNNNGATEVESLNGSSSSSVEMKNGKSTDANTSKSKKSISSSFKPSTGLVERLTSKYRAPSLGRQGTKLIGVPSKSSSESSSTSNGSNASSMTLLDQNDLPVDIDIALDDMLGREFADHLNEWLTQHGQEEISVGVVLKNPEKSKHLETATMKVGKFWIDFVNLRAEEYTEDSRIPDLMRIGTAHEDAFRRDLTINALFYNINTGQVEDFTGNGFDDLRKGIIATPLPALTTLLDDPLRVLRSVRFAARLRFTMEESLIKAAKDERVRVALAQKVARERIGAEVDLMLRSQDPVGAMRLLINLNLARTVFSIKDINPGKDGELANLVFTRGLNLLSTTHDHLVDCKVNVPIWCEKKRVTAAATNGVNEVVLMEDEELRRKLWYASFLKPLRDHCQMMRPIEKAQVGRRQGKKANRSVIMKIMVDELKRPVRDGDAVEAIMKGADDFTNLLNAGCNLSSTACLLSEIRVIRTGFDADTNKITCLMGERVIDSESEDDPIWQGTMEYRLLVSKVLKRLGPLWRAAMVLSLSEQLAVIEGEELSYTIEGDVVSVHCFSPQNYHLIDYKLTLHFC